MRPSYKDPRCPCNQCFIQTSCTDYCNWFHTYRKLVLAEVDYFCLCCDPSYEFLKQEGNQRFMGDIQQDIEIAYRRTGELKRLKDEYIKCKKNLRYLDYRFDVICNNSRAANRGVFCKG